MGHIHSSLPSPCTFSSLTGIHPWTRSVVYSSL
jgi:hypothetical protein